MQSVRLYDLLRVQTRAQVNSYVSSQAKQISTQKLSLYQQTRDQTSADVRIQVMTHIAAEVEHRMARGTEPFSRRWE